MSIKQKGFSLIETLVALAIGMIIAGAVTALMMSQLQLTATNNRNIIGQQNVRDVLQFVGDEIQLMGTHGVIEPYIVEAAAGDLLFVADVNGDEDMDRVSFYLLEGQLLRGYSTSNDAGVSWSPVVTDVLLDNVTTLAFEYYEPNNVVATDVDLITSIEIAIAISTAADETAYTSGKIAEHQMVSRITIRNRRI